MTHFTTPAELASWIDSSSNPGIRAFFDKSTERIVSRAPGRLDLMGGIADYSGSLVLQWPIREATWAVLQRTDEPMLQIATARCDAPTIKSSTKIALSSLSAADGEPISYQQARQILTSNPETRWAAYVFGVFLVLMHECQAVFQSGARILIISDLPEGKGVSSSAALEVATMQAVAETFGIVFDQCELAILCQKVENEVVGAPCGVMDQMASACAEAGSLMALRCRPAELLGNVVMPEGVSIWGIDSGIRHSVSGANYGTVRTAAFMGLAIIERLTGTSLSGYLTTLSPSQAEVLAGSLPGSISGVEFTELYGPVPDRQSTVIPERQYPVKAATLHPIAEHFRVSLVNELLSLPVTNERLFLLGELMVQAHAGYSSCGLGTPQTDRLVELVREHGPDYGLYGAKITGGGSGGTVAVLGHTGSDKVIKSIAEKYQSETGLAPTIFAGTSPGAFAFGVHRF
jgi:galactokinase